MVSFRFLDLSWDSSHLTPAFLFLNLVILPHLTSRLLPFLSGTPFSPKEAPGGTTIFGVVATGGWETLPISNCVSVKNLKTQLENETPMRSYIIELDDGKIYRKPQTIRWSKPWFPVNFLNKTNPLIFPIYGKIKSCSNPPTRWEYQSHQPGGWIIYEIHEFYEFSPPNSLAFATAGTWQRCRISMLQGASPTWGLDPGMTGGSKWKTNRESPGERLKFTGWRELDYIIFFLDW